MMDGELVTINSRNYDGTIRRSWRCRFAKQCGSRLSFDGVFDRDIEHQDLGIIRRGTVSYEYYWLDRWYNVFRFHEPDGEFRNFYCNINTPPIFRRGVLDYVDLDLDIVIWPGGSFKILDQDEFALNVDVFNYPPDVIAAALGTVRDLVGLIESGKFPPA